MVQHDHLRYPIGSLGQLFLFCPLPASCASPAFLLARQHEKQKSPWLSVSTTQPQLKHQCDANIILILNPKYSIVPATMKKINPIPAKTRTFRTQNSWFYNTSSFIVCFDFFELRNIIQTYNYQRMLTSHFPTGYFKRKILQQTPVLSLEEFRTSTEIRKMFFIRNHSDWKSWNLQSVFTGRNEWMSDIPRQ